MGVEYLSLYVGIVVLSIFNNLYLEHMYSNWAQFINEFKCMIFADRRALNQLRLALTDEQIDNFWDARTLQQMQAVFTITNDYILNFIVSQLLQPYLNSRKIIYQAYIVSRSQNSQEQSLMYVYDCRLFRNNSYQKQQNDFISSFLLCYRENVDIDCPVFEVVDPKQLPPNRWALKVKESGLLRVYTYIKDTMKKVRHRSDKIVLPEEKYLEFAQEWMKCYYNYNIDITVSYFFKAVLALLQNQILLHYIHTLAPQQLRERMYLRPIRIIDKPKNVEQFTLTEGIAETQTKWQTLKITAFRLKYRVDELQDKYYCYRVEEVEEDPTEETLTEEDHLIILAFSQLQQLQEEYQSLYQ